MQPEKIGIYEIKSELGRGGMATVYRGYDPRFEREVAVKVLPSELLHADPQFRLRFEREAKIIAQLEHTAIVPVYDVGDADGQPYFVMRYMNGGSLSERIKAGGITIEEAARILGAIAPGLDEAHSKAIVHRDIKPSNILFDRRGNPYISDFGIAKLSQAQAGNVTGSAIIGTPAYMAPEQAQGNEVDG
jgi:serine/threonine-protein kinase